MIERVREGIGRARFTVKALRNIGVFRGLRPRGLAAFARRLTGLRMKPHMALVLHASTRPNDLALVADGVRYTFTSLDRRINRLANVLRSAGLGRNAPVAMMMHNSGDYIVALEALPRLGAAAVQVGYRLKAPEIAHIIDNSQPKAFILDAEFAPTVAEALEQADHQPLIVLTRGDASRTIEDAIEIEPALEAAPENDLPRAESGDGGSVIVYTSGTTGKPKGASRDLSDTGLGAVIDMLDQLGAKQDERHLVVCPLYHSAAPAFVKMIYAIGGAVVVLPKFDPDLVLQTIEDESITSAFMVPTQLRRLADVEPEVLRRYGTSSLRWVVSGAAPLPTETARRFQASFGPILSNFYGATETGTVSMAGPADHLARPGTVGRLLRENEALITDEDGNPRPPGYIGELWIRNSMLISGYHRNESATSKAVKDGFFSVGDLARFDNDGFLYIESRVHDMIISGGVNIYPREIEDVLHANEQIREAAVVGLPDDEWGEVVAAFVVKEEGGISANVVDEDAVVECVRDSLADFKKPRRVFFVDELPRNPTGKVLKRVLRESV